MTNEVIGPFKNGGIGTAMTGLAETLAESGHRVTVLYTGHAGTAAVGLDRWREVYRAKGIELVALTLEDSSHLDGPVRHASLGTPWLIYAYLVEHRFDVVHFNDCRGEGSLALAAKRLNIAFHDTLLAVGLHSPSQWVLELNNTAKSSTPLAAFSYAEHLSVKCADLIWSPSRYMVGWVRDHDFALPAETFIQQYAIPATAPFPAMESRRTAKPTEIVFFGRLEERKGLRLFCNALDSLRDELAARNVTITFLGKPHTCGGMSSLEYLAKRSRDWRFPTQILTDHGQPEALAYLRANDRVAVIASPVDNSPCTVYEALAWGLPFLASRGGGIPELIHEDDRDQVLFDHSTPALRAALLDVLDHGGFTARPSVTQAESRRSWSAMHANWRAFLPPPPRMSHVGPRNIVALVDHDGRANLDATLESLKTCANIRRIVVLASAAPYVGQTLLSVLANQQKGQTGVSVLHRDPDALRGVLASLADDAVLLVHSGLTVLPDALERMRVSLRAEGVEGFLPAGLLHGEKRNPILPPLGGSAPFALFEGATFTGGLLVRADVLLRAASNRALAIESAFLGLADFCIVHGEIWPFPEIAFEGPEKTWPRPRSEDPARVAVYAECSPTDRLYITAAGYAATQRVAAPYGRRQIALALIDAGFAPLVRAGVWGLRHARRAVRGLRKR